MHSRTSSIIIHRSWASISTSSIRTHTAWPLAMAHARHPNSSRPSHTGTAANLGALARALARPALHHGGMPSPTVLGSTRPRQQSRPRRTGGGREPCCCCRSVSREVAVCREQSAEVEQSAAEARYLTHRDSPSPLRAKVGHARVFAAPLLPSAYLHHLEKSNAMRGNDQAPPKADSAPHVCQGSHAISRLAAPQGCALCSACMHAYNCMDLQAEGRAATLRSRRSCTHTLTAAGCCTNRLYIYSLALPACNASGNGSRPRKPHERDVRAEEATLPAAAEPPRTRRIELQRGCAALSILIIIGKTCRANANANAARQAPPLYIHSSAVHPTPPHHTL